MRNKFCLSIVDKHDPCSSTLKLWNKHLGHIQLSVNSSFSRIKAK